ncbi:MAG: DUF1934 domain-containing protein [Dorea sp.]
MTKDVLLSISGLHYDMSGNADDYEDNEENEPIEMITPAAYYLKNGKHYVLYDEVVEGIPGVIKNKVRITGEEKLEIIKSGLTNTHMIFEKDKIHMTEYETPYGELMMGVHTKEMRVDVQESLIEVRVNYALDINSEPVADCNISLNIKALEH